MLYICKMYMLSNLLSNPTGDTIEENTNIPDVVTVSVLSAVAGIFAVLLAVVIITRVSNFRTSRIFQPILAIYARTKLME